MVYTPPPGPINLLNGNKTIAPWTVFAIIAPVYFFSMFHRIAPSILVPELAADLNVPIPSLDILGGATFITYGLMQLPAGLLTDALGGRKALCLICIANCIGVTCFALSTTLAEATASRALIGIGCSTFVPGIALLAYYFHPRVFARVNGYFTALGAMGSVLAGTPLAIASTMFGWRTCMLVCASIMAALGLIVWTFLKENTSRPAETHATKTDKHPGLFQGLGMVLKTKTFWPPCIWFACTSGLYFAFGGLWWGAFLREGCNLSKEDAGQIMSVAFICVIVGQPIMAMLAERLGGRRRLIQAGTFLGLIAMLVMAMAKGTLPFAAHFVLGILFTLAGVTFAVLIFGALRTTFPAHMVGRAAGCMQTLPYLFAVPIIQKLFGGVLEWRLEVHGNNALLAYADAMYVNVAVLAIALVVSFFIDDPKSDETTD